METEALCNNPCGLEPDNCPNCSKAIIKNDEEFVEVILGTVYDFPDSYDY